MSSGQIETTEYELSALTIITSSTKPIDIKFQVKDLNIYQDIFSSSLSGDLLIEDSMNLPTAYSMCGMEYVYMKISNPGLKPIEKYFRIYKLSDHSVRNLNSTSFTIHFCSEEFILNQQKRISKSYKKVKTHQIIGDILLNSLKVPKERMFIEETYGVHSYDWTKNENPIIIPNMKPFEAINWLGSFSINKNLSSAFVFYENQFGFNFASLDKIFEDQVYKQITLQPKNTPSDNDTKQLNHCGPDKYQIKQFFNVLETQSTGGYRSSMLRLNLTTQEHKNIQFSPAKNITNHLNDYLPFNNATNRFDLSQLDESSYVRYFPSFQGDLTDKWLLQRACQFSLLNSYRMSIQLAGDCQLTAGAVLDLSFPLMTASDSPKKITEDPFISGKYVVTSLRHRITDNKFFCYAEICKDSAKASYPPYGGNESYDKAKAS